MSNISNTIYRARAELRSRKRNMSSIEKEIFENLKAFEIAATAIPIEEVFKKIGRYDSLYSENNTYIQNVEGTMINIGTRRGNIDILNYAMKRLRSKIKIYKSDLMLYNIGNGLLSVAEIKYRSAPSIENLFNISEYREARKYFFLIKEKHLFPQAITNYANILEKYGRNYEAILSYDKALRVNPEFGMALGNKGIGIRYYFNLTHQKDQKLILLARDLLKKALESDNTVKIGGQSAVDYFKSNMTSLNEYIAANKISYSNKNDLTPKTDYESFCKKNDVFLNYCFNCYRCEKGLIDEFAPTFLSIKEDSKEDDIIEHGGMPRKIYYSIKILNQIVEDYSTARYIYFMSIYDNFDSIDKASLYFSALDYCRNSLKYGFKKTSFIKLFNILDKISHLVWSYYHPSDLKKTYFSSLLRPEYKETIINRNNFSLLALHDLALDFQDDAFFYRLNKIRNYLTHDYIDIKEEMNGRDTIEEEFLTKHHLTEEMMDQYIKDLLSIVKAALIYFINALDTDNRKTGNANKTLTLIIPTQKYIFSE